MFIGGKKYATTVDTLTQREPYSMLAAMFSGRHNVCRDSETGMVFVDRDGKQFRHILNWLRDGILPTLTNVEYQELLREAEYYQLLELIKYIKSNMCKKKGEDILEAELTRKEIIKIIQSSKIRFRGVNLSGLNLSKLVSFKSI
ncbi:FH protein interacting protein FIP2 [Dendrobium catenatum]|uniref:FH protein interacting protein FIP2 n=1 Tax=Dendrobium catenatum TaxID=906689 RepID=A0A2I0VIN7_9ASPA|nr:FH protein interacting protein FIP2 [Dendrobium catenatum]